MSTAPDKIDEITPASELGSKLHVRLMSFGYKQGAAPSANAVFDVRFLKNPYWVEELRPLTGRDKAVQEYVMNQKAASEFIESLINLFSRLFPELAKSDLREFSIAFGCTGGQHRSTIMVELLAVRLGETFPGIKVDRIHRELDGKTLSGSLAHPNINISDKQNKNQEAAGTESEDSDSKGSEARVMESRGQKSIGGNP